MSTPNSQRSPSWSPMAKAKSLFGYLVSVHVLVSVRGPPAAEAVAHWPSDSVAPHCPTGLGEEIPRTCPKKSVVSAVMVTRILEFGFVDDTGLAASWANNTGTGVPSGKLVSAYSNRRCDGFVLTRRPLGICLERTEVLSAGKRCRVAAFCAARSLTKYRPPSMTSAKKPKITGRAATKSTSVCPSSRRMRVKERRPGATEDRHAGVSSRATSST